MNKILDAIANRAWGAFVKVVIAGALVAAVNAVPGLDLDPTVNLVLVGALNSAINYLNPRDVRGGLS